MTVNLLKRLESSVEAFRITLRKVEAASTTLCRIWMTRTAGSPTSAGLRRHRGRR
ncbi:hypothetical protein NKG05_26020 [Oerskovia sp. M15]